METFIGHIKNDGIDYVDYIQSQYDSYLKSLPNGQPVEVTIKPLREGKTLRQLGGIFGVWLGIIVDHMTEKGITLENRIGNKTYQVVPNKQNVKELLYAACGSGKTLSRMDKKETSKFMESIRDFCAMNETLDHLYLPDLDPEKRRR